MSVDGLDEMYAERLGKIIVKVVVIKRNITMTPLRSARYQWRFHKKKAGEDTEAARRIDAVTIAGRKKAAPGLRGIALAPRRARPMMRDVPIATDETLFSVYERYKNQPMMYARGGKTGAIYVTSCVLEIEKKTKIKAAQTKQKIRASLKGSRFLISL